MHRLITNQQIKHNTKTITLNNLESNAKVLPEIFVQFKNSTIHSLQIALCDSGSQANILSLQQFLDLGFAEETIQKCENFNIRSSTELVENCIRGKVTLDMYCLLQPINIQQSNQFRVW